MNLDSTQYKNLFSPLTSRPPAAPQPAAVQGGNGWNAGLNLGADSGSFNAGATGGSSPVQLGGTTNDLKQNMLAIFQEGVNQDLAGGNQLRTLQGYLGQLSAGQLNSIAGLMNQAGTKVEQIFILKAYAAGEPWANLVQYAGEMRGKSEQEIISKSTMRDDADVIQQWQDSCGPTLVQTLAGEADPRFAWELNKGGDLTRIDPNGANNAIASQQKQWLEQYGGVAVERGAPGGAGMALTQILNDMVGSLTGASYNTVEVPQPGAAVGTIAQTLQSGYDVPLRVSWDQPGSGQDSGHFVLAMSVRDGGAGREIQIHDPWTGKTAWVGENNIANNNFSPIFGSYARLSHYYAPQPTSMA